MGAGSWDSSRYAAHSLTLRSKGLHEVFATTASTYHAKTGSKDSLNPLGVKIRESRDSDVNPASSALIVGVDVTGSMGMLAETMAKDGLGVLFDEVLKRKPISDPHLMFMAIGDANCDEAPLQASQFEADHRIIPQLQDIWVEHGGGGNRFESYNLPWYFAAMHTSIDCFEKRGKKGYLFTAGDEEVPGPLSRAQIERFIGDKPERDLDNSDLLAMVSRTYHVFHLMVAEGSHARAAPDAVRRGWTDLLGQRALWLTDHTKMSEVIVSTIQVTEGADREAVAKSWSGKTALVVRDAISGLPALPGSGGAVTRL